MKRTTGVLVRNEAGKPVTFLASTAELASDGLIIDPRGWDTSRFERQGSPVFWGHDYSKPPIGKASNVRVTDAGLVMDVAFDETSGDDFARMIAAKVRSGVVNACSVGFEVLEQVKNKVNRAALLELSIVGLGADPGAVAIARSRYRSTTRPPVRTLADLHRQTLITANSIEAEARAARIDRATRDLIGAALAAKVTGRTIERSDIAAIIGEAK